MFNKLFDKNFLNWLFVPRPHETPASPIAPGLYHLMREADGAYTRFHLRVEADGSGMLLTNASAAARLNTSGTLIAKKLLDGEDEMVILRALEARFRGVPQPTLRGDIARVRDLMDRLATPTGEYPLISSEDAAFSLYTARLIAPLQATVPLASPDQMLPIINRLWEVGIPHMNILAPAQPDEDSLLRAIERAEDLGMIAGVRGRASDVQEIGLLRDMALAGVDYITIPYAPVDAEIHDRLYGTGDHATAERVFSTIHEYEVCPVAKVPLIQTTLDTLERTLDKLSALDVNQVSFFAIATPDDHPEEQRGGALSVSELIQVGTLLEETAYQFNIQYVWQMPVLYTPGIPLDAQVQHGSRCAGDAAVLVEPDGTVIPSRGAYRSVGNILRDPWETIWKNPAFRIYRERVPEPERVNIYADPSIFTEPHFSEQAGEPATGEPS